MNDLSQGELLTGWKGFWWWKPVTWIPPAPVPCPPPWCWPPSPAPHGLGWTVFVQCRDSVASANTLLPDWCWQGCTVHTCAVVTGLRNGVPCRCFCPAGRCEGKSGRQHRFRPWLAPPRRCC